MNAIIRLAVLITVGLTFAVAPSAPVAASTSDPERCFVIEDGQGRPVYTVCVPLP